MPSREWEHFMRNYYGDPYMMWHDGIDEKSVTNLQGQEREKAEEMLLNSLQAGSHYGAIGLRELKSNKSIPFLERGLKKSQGKLKIEIAVALSMINESLEYIPYILSVLKNSPFWSFRMDAARALRRFPKQDVVDSLFEAVARDPHYLVRNHASQTILFLHRLKPQISMYKEIFRHMIVDYEKNDQVSREDAFKHYEKSAELLEDLVSSKGKLREDFTLEDIWTW